MLFASLSMDAVCQKPGCFTNPVIAGDVPDPSIIRIDDTYYATGTSSEWAPFYPVFVSKDLVNWTQEGHVFDKKPGWTSNSFWAPELFYHDGKVFCYYTARKKANGVSYIGVATADSPTGGFTDHGPLIEYGTEAIDAFVFDDNGQLYISWKAYGLDKRPIEILGSKLSADGLRLEGEPFTLLVDDENIGMEGQYHFKHGDYYYIVYSAHGCCGPASDYDVYVARSERYAGPYEKYSGNPILHGGEGDYQSCGHGTAVATKDGRMFYMCHAYMADASFYAGRQPVLQEMYVSDDDGWVHFKTGATGLAEQPLPFKGTVQKKATCFEDNFDGSKLKVDWSWNYPYSDVRTMLKDGRLLLWGVPEKGNRHGSALCVRARKADYECETRIVSRNESFQGLTMYGDDKNLILWGMKGDRLVLTVVKDNVETVLYETSMRKKSPFLKMKVTQGCVPEFFWSVNGRKWTAVKDDSSFDGRQLVRWDRVFRPGLIHIGDAGTPAEYSYFKMSDTVRE